MKQIRPEYFMNPAQILRRILYSLNITKNRTWAKTPWGLTINFDPNELHGRAMLTLGLIDLRSCEVIYRLLQTGDTAIDIGANIGIMTSIMAKKVGSQGSVFAFEPHPVTRELLNSNVIQWSKDRQNISHVSVIPFAVSDLNGTATLFEPLTFERNSGLATLEKSFGADLKKEGVEVNCITFDSFWGIKDKIKLIKIDVEGHEDAVLAGMKEVLTKSLVECILFEESRPLPSPACHYLGEFGYTTYIIDRDLSGPRLANIKSQSKSLRGETTNVLAISSKSSDLKTLGLTRLGWSCLSAK